MHQNESPASSREQPDIISISPDVAGRVSRLIDGTAFPRPGAGVSAYGRYPYLRDYAAVLGVPELCDVVGEGNNAIIVRHPQDDGLVVKIAKPGDTDALAQEFINHADALAAFRAAQAAEANAPDVEMPGIFHAPTTDEHYFFLTRVPGQSFQTRCLVDRYRNAFPADLRAALDALSDGEVRVALRETLGFDDDRIARTIEDYAQDYLAPVLYDCLRPTQRTPVAAALDALAAAGVGHADVHPGNFMAGRDGKTYVIDFGRVKRTPLNVASNGATETECLLSNLAPAPFTLDGRRYASVEGFWQGLKFPDQTRRDEIARLDGLPSKKIGDEAPKSETFAYEGATVRVGSPEHHGLMYCAIRAKLEQNPEILKLLVETGTRPIVHRPMKKDGTPYPDSVTVPEAVFSAMLMKLREELAG